jgi:indole-3-glycerol phosphate synthase
VALIAELKKASPSAGLLRPRYDPVEGARAYARAGAAALSVLTENHYFKGNLTHIARVKRAVNLPVLRKDFLVDPYQVYESRANGADAVLLIVALLTDRVLRELLGLARRLGLAALVEAHTPGELRRAVAAGADMVGINSRNLSDLTMNPSAFRTMIPLIPRRCLRVAESGIKTPRDVTELKNIGADAMLVGESFLRQNDLEKAARTLARAGRK